MDIWDSALWSMVRGFLLLGLTGLVLWLLVGFCNSCSNRRWEKEEERFRRRLEDWCRRRGVSQFTPILDEFKDPDEDENDIPDWWC